MHAHITSIDNAYLLGLLSQLVNPPSPKLSKLVCLFDVVFLQV